MKVFTQHLRELGWTDGGNIRIHVRIGAGRPDRVRSYAAELAAMKPDVLGANSGPSLAALLGETRTIPIVFASVLDPVGSGFVASLANPGGNATGFASLDPAITGKWLELLKEVAPNVTHVAAIFDRDNAYFAQFTRVIQELAPSFHLEYSPAPIANLADIQRAVDSVGARSGGSLIVMGTIAAANRQSIVALAGSRGLPAIYQFAFHVPHFSR